jgi:group II intron reverse transcriptase/maturase
MILSISAIISIFLPILMTVAFVTIAERKIMASMQRRCGPNAVGFYGLLQPFADALKLLFKEIIIPRQSNNQLFIIGPFITLIFSLLGWSVIPYAEGITIFDFELGVLVAIAIASLGSYGILISGWAANSKYAFIGSIRSTAQLLSYELVLSSIIFIIIIFAGSLSFTLVVEAQKAVWFIFPLLPIGLCFFIAILAETNRAPFDLPEAESELVAGLCGVWVTSDRWSRKTLFWVIKLKLLRILEMNYAFGCVSYRNNQLTNYKIKIMNSFNGSLSGNMVVFGSVNWRYYSTSKTMNPAESRTPIVEIRHLTEVKDSNQNQQSSIESGKSLVGWVSYSVPTNDQSETTTRSIIRKNEPSGEIRKGIKLVSILKFESYDVMHEGISVSTAAELIGRSVSWTYRHLKLDLTIRMASVNMVYYNKIRVLLILNEEKGLFLSFHDPYLKVKTIISNESVTNSVKPVKTSKLDEPIKLAKPNELDKPVSGIESTTNSISESTISMNNFVKTALIKGCLEKLKKIAPNNDGKYRKLSTFLWDPYFLLMAYENIKSKPGNMTEGGDGVILDKINWKWFLTTSELLKAGKYKVSPARILKPGEFIIMNPRDKIIQEAVRLLIEPIFEKEFLPSSHGFRPNKSCHTALKAIKLGWKNMSWFIKFDISKYFDTINRQILFKLMNSRIQDQALFDLLHKFFNSGTIGIQNSRSISRQGIPQGCILSPLLANIYLHELDKEINLLKSEYETHKKTRAVNLEFLKETRISKVDRRNLSKKDLAELRKTKLSNAYKKGLVRTVLKDPDFIKLNYVRYADDFLIGFSGPKSICKKIMNRIIFFLQSSLHLKVNEDKTRLVHAFSNKVSFLGVELQNIKPIDRPKRLIGDLMQISKSASRMRVYRDRLLKVKAKKERDLLNKVLTKLTARHSDKPKAYQSKEVKNTIICLLEEAVKEHEFKNDLITSLTEYYTSTANRILSSNDPEFKKANEAIKLAISKIDEVSFPNMNRLKKERAEIASKTLKNKGNINSIEAMYMKGKRYSLLIQIKANMKQIVSKYFTRGLVNKIGKPIALRRMIWEEPSVIIKYYNSIAYGLLSYFRCCDNFYRIKSFVNYQLRWSLLHTLAAKHKTTIRKILIDKYIDLSLKIDNKVIQFIPLHVVNGMRKDFLINIEEYDWYTNLDKTFIKTTKSFIFAKTCAIKDCPNTDIEIHHIRKLLRPISSGGLKVVNSKGNKGWNAFMSAINRKQVPLCKNHHIELHKGTLDFKLVDKKAIK